MKKHRTILELKNVSFTYDKVPVLEDVSLSVQSGEFIGIFGPNGGGKTTLLKLILGFLRPEQGTVSLLGKAPKNRRSEVGYVPQVLSYDKAFPISAFDVVMTGLIGELPWWGGYTKKLKRQGREALEQVGLAQIENQPFGTLSGGQAQRVLIARALVSLPKILILDEPTANVDPYAGQEILNLLLTLNQTVTILMVTHDLQVIVEKCKRLLCVNRKISSLKAKEVCEHFALGLYHTPLTSNDHFACP